MPVFPLGRNLIKHPRKRRIRNPTLPQYPIGKTLIKKIISNPFQFSLFPNESNGHMNYGGGAIIMDSPSIVISAPEELDDPYDPIIKNIGVNVNALINMFSFAPSPDD